jgi:phage terminase small subunit
VQLGYPHGMPHDGLSARQQRFAEGVINGLPASRAYTEAGYCSKSPDQDASNLDRNPKVAARIEQLRLDAARRNEITVDRILQELEDARIRALKDGQFSAAVAASMGRAKIAGQITDRTEQVWHKPSAVAGAPTYEMSEAEWVEKYSPSRPQ